MRVGLAHPGEVGGDHDRNCCRALKGRAEGIADHVMLDSEDVYGSIKSIKIYFINFD
jgi:hypothetical protein